MKLHSMLCRMLLSCVLFYILASGSQLHAVAHAQIYSLVTQIPYSKTGSLVKMNLIDSMEGFELSPTKDFLIAKTDGLYFLMFTGQIGSETPGSEGYVDCWFVKNGKPLPNTTKRQTVNTSNFAGLMNTGLIIALAVGDTFGIMFSASGPSLGLIHIKPSVAPGITSVNFTIFKID